MSHCQVMVSRMPTMQHKLLHILPFLGKRVSAEHHRLLFIDCISDKHECSVSFSNKNLHSGKNC